MVARIIRGKDIVGLIKYNEKEHSSVLYAQLINDLKDPEELTLQDKIQGLQAYLRLNPKIGKPTFHVSLNPDPEDRLSDEQLTEIAREYLERMNYGQQPYLIYKHEDIERTHLHLVSVSIGLDGKAIPSSQDRYRSEEIRKDLEAKYGLVPAGEKISKGKNVFEPIDVPAIEYGKTDTKSAIASVVRSAAREYRFSSLAEYKALLNQYHVTVEEVTVPNDPSKTLGLFYGIINPAGERVGSRIKASSIGKEVGWPALSAKFTVDERKIRDSNVRATLCGKITAVLTAYPYLTLAHFKERLQEQGIQVVCRESKEKGLAGLTFIDAHTKTVLDSQALGSAYSAATLGQRFAGATLARPELQKANRELVRIYHSYRKTDQNYFFESSLIKALPQLTGALALQLQKQVPQLEGKQAELAVRHFMEYRQRQLPLVQEKENGYFRANTPPLLHYVQSNGELPLRQKLSFLYALRITFSQRGEDLLIHSSKSPAVGYTVPNTTLSHLLGVPVPPGKLTVSEREIPVLRKIDREILKMMSQAPEEREYGTLRLGERIGGLDRSPLLPFLTNADRHLLLSHANREYAAEVFQGMDKGGGYPQILSHLLENGLLIKSITGRGGERRGYLLGYHTLPESTFVKAGTMLTNLLTSHGFSPETEASVKRLVFRESQNGGVTVSPKYRVLVTLSQALQRNDLKATRDVLRLIHRINKPLADRIEQRLAETLPRSRKDPGAENRQATDLIPLIRKEIAEYPSDTLREPSQNAALIRLYRPESRHGAHLLEGLGILFRDFAAAVFGNEQGEKEEHRPEQKRKRRRRPRW
ncbi:relaxase/mobilization nuclease domain-containing protein [Rufibacter sediminis]|uniref:Relaxase/mobilization nuclease domain-containing protein n=1 Tax=Rufibacter sediminis TaxID=2762756 RepID=A0ABR6VP77_9BACT|nr:relaxase/mobilization nuclease domain-containing protein [Rufibacter sediminis]MBC3538962.1 relaxase/mobilization nuclease domain-containing protein [Rufibacter sediminis]